MKKITLCTVLLAVAAAALGIERFTPATGSLVRVEGTSTLHDWKMEGNTINGRVEVTDPATKAAAVSVSIPVTSIRSEHERMDRLMADALKAKSNPEIRYEMMSASLQGDEGATFTMKTVGKLTIAGVTREIVMDVTGTRASDGRYVLAGQAPIRMTEFGIQPPRAMMNTIRTGDDVKVTFRWVVESD